MFGFTKAERKEILTLLRQIADDTGEMTNGSPSQKSLAALTRQLHAAQSALTIMAINLDNLTAAIEALKQKANGSQAIIDSLTAEKQALTDQVTQLTNDDAASQAAVDALTADVTAAVG